MELDNPEPSTRVPQLPYHQEDSNSPSPPSRPTPNALMCPDVFRIPEMPKKGPASKKRILDLFPPTPTLFTYTSSKSRLPARDTTYLNWDFPPFSAEEDSNDQSPDGQLAREAKAAFTRDDTQRNFVRQQILNICRAVDDQLTFMHERASREAQALANDLSEVLKCHCKALTYSIDPSQHRISATPLQPS